VIEPTENGLLLKELAPGISVETVIAATTAPLTISDSLSVMRLD
jgi:acetate CoA/acetoacetate CoA-transferase beta subunit